MDVNHFGFQPGTIFSECAQKEEEGGRERGREGERTSLCGGRHAPPAAAPAEWSPAQSRRRKEKKTTTTTTKKKVEVPRFLPGGKPLFGAAHGSSPTAPGG